MFIRETLLVGIMLFIPSISIVGIDWNDDEIEWHGYADGIEKAQQENKNIFLVVYADWCGVCKQYSKMFLDPEVIKYSRNVVLIKINQDVDKYYSQEYSLDGGYVPRTYILDKDLKIQPSPYKSRQYAYYLPPGSNRLLVDILKKFKP